MSVFIKSVNVPSVDPAGIASIANRLVLPGIKPVVLNGPLVNNQGIVSFQDKGYSSAISFTSPHNMANQSFIVEGTSNGVYVSEEIAAPNINTVTTETMFDIVTGIKIHDRPPHIEVDDFTIGANSNVITTFDSYLDTKKAGASSNGFALLTSNIAATTNWSAGSYIQYGIAGNNLTGPLKTTDFEYGNRLVNYIAINNPTEATSSDTLNRGITTNEQHPYLAIAVVILNGVNITPSYIEMAQNV